MLLAFENGITSVIHRVWIQDTSVSTGAGLTGLTEASSGLIISTIANNESAVTRYRAGSSEIETISTLGTFAAPTSGKCRFKEVDATNLPGLYEVQIADARWAVSNARSLIIRVLVTGGISAPALVQLYAVPANVQKFGGSAGTFASGRPEVKVDNIAANAITATSIASDAFAASKFADGCLTAAKFASGAFDAVWSVASRTLSAFGFSVTVGANNDKTGYALTSAYDAAKTAASPSDVAAELETYDAPTKAEFDAAVALLATAATLALVKAQTDLIPATPASTGDAMALTTSERAALADKFLGRTRAGGGDGGRTVAQALAPLRNKVAMTAINESAGTATMTVYDDDDTTPLYTYAVSLTTLAKSMTALDPAS